MKKRVDNGAAVRPTRFLPIFLGFCFFFNPYFSVVDVLPDCIGALLIALGLLPLSRIYYPMQEARRGFLRFALADLVKNVLLLFVFSIGNAAEQELLLLIVAFLSATVGAIFFVSALRSFFYGLQMLAGSYECEALYAMTDGRRSRTERFAKLTVFFVIFREVLSLLPEFVVLLNSTYVESPFSRLYEHLGFMRLLLLFPIAFMGLVWLGMLIRYFVCLWRQRAFRVALAEKYTVYMQAHPGIRVKARYCAAFLLIAAGFFLFTDFYVDFRNILPDVLGGVLVLLGVLLFDTKITERLLALFSCTAYAAAAYVSSGKAYLFSVRYIGVDIARGDDAAAAYSAMWISALVEFFAFLLMAAAVLLALRGALKKWGGYCAEQGVEYDMRRLQRMQEEMDWQFIKCFILVFVSGILSFFFDYFKVWPNTRIFRLMEGFWILDFSVALVLGAYVAYTLSLVLQHIKERFMYE